MCRVFNVNNSTIFFNGKFAPAQFFKALGENHLLNRIHNQREHVNMLVSSHATCSKVPVKSSDFRVFDLTGLLRLRRVR